MSSPDVPYRELFEANPHPMVVYDIETLRFLAVNDAAVRRYGWSREEFLGMTLREMVPAETRASVESAVAASAETVNAVSVWRLQTKQGEQLLVELTSHRFRCGDRPARLVVAYDVTAQEAARESDERFRTVARVAADAIWDWDLATDAIWWSEGMSALFGGLDAGQPDTIEDWRQRLHPDDRSRVLAGIEAVVQGSGDEWSDEYRFRRSDGSYAIVSDRGLVIRALDGSPVRVVGGMSDLTERRQLEAQIQRAQRMESIGTLAGGIAHDLNNILSPILMSIGLLREHVASTGGQEILEMIEASTKRGADLVRQVLTYARGIEGQRMSIAVAELAAEMARFVKDTFPGNIRLVVDVPEGIWPVIGDPAQLQRVLVNLFVNARDAMPDGGTVTLGAANEILGEREAAQIPDANAGNFVRLSVSDDGCGMVAHVRERIFEPFFTTKDVGKGSGLGLSTVQAIVLSHGGFVGVRSAPGKGSTFEVHLPTDPRAAEPAAARRRPTPARGISTLVLLVDDEPSIRGFAARLLERKGHRVLTAAGGDEAIAVFTAHAAEVALVITDLGMPGVDGRAVIRCIHRVAPTTPIIVMSGLDSLPELDRGTSAGAPTAGAPSVWHLRKPFGAEELDGAVRRALSQRSTS